MRINIAVKLAGVFTLVCLSLLVLVALVASVMTTKGMQNQANKRLDNDMAVTLHMFDYFAQDALSSAQMLANNPKVLRHMTAPTDTGTLHEILDLLPQNRIVRFFDADGNPILDRGLSKSALDMTSSGVQLALANEPVKGVEPLGDMGMAVRGIAPIRIGNRVVGAVLVGSSLDQAFVDQIKAITGLDVGVASGNSISSQWLAQTIHASGKAQLAELPPSVVRQVRETGKISKENILINQEEYMGAFAPLFGDYGEFVGLLFIGEPRKPLMQHANQAQLLILALAMIGAVLVSVIATLLSRTITNPIRQLVKQATAITQGDLTQRVTIDTGDELEQLANAFNLMGESLAVMQFHDQNANPLTKLPGNAVIESEIECRLKRQDELAVLYIDLDHFKAFNDKFGFEQGDRVIQLCSSVLCQAMNMVDNPGDFIGHIGGDDFIVITHPRVAERLAREIIHLFDAQVPALYPEEDRTRGFIVSIDRRGMRQEFPLCSLSIALVSNEHRQIKDVLELSSLAAEVKKYAKSLDGSSLARDRRLDKTAPLDSASLG